MFTYNQIRFAYQPARERKDNDKAGRYIKTSSKHVQKQNFAMALQFCNMSICFAEKETEVLGLAYLERAKTLIKMRRSKDALFNLRLAAEVKLTEALHERLKILESECNDLSDDEVEEDFKYEFSLSREPGEVNPWIAKCLEQRMVEDMGVGIFTTEDLYPAELLAIERPFVNFLLAEKRYIRCAYCLKENYFTMIPCDKCTITMFCNSKCMKKASRKFHKIECPIIDVFLRVFDKMNVGLHMVYTYFTMFPNVAAARDFRYLSVQRKDLSNPKLRNLHAIQTLGTYIDDRDAYELFLYKNMIWTQRDFLLDYSPLRHELGTGGEQVFLEGLISHYTYLTPANAFDLAALNVETEEMELYGAAFYPFCSRLNHSCAPNATLIFQNGKCLLFAIRPIRANEQIFISYGPHFLNDEILIRQRILNTIYKFKCRCEACEGDYPLFDGIRPALNKWNNFYDLRPYCYNSALSYTRYRRLLLAEDYRFYPCTELCMAEECLKIELNILAGAVPLSSKGRLKNDDIDKNPRNPTVKFSQGFIDEEDQYKKAFTQSYVKKFFNDYRERTNIFELRAISEGLQDMSLFEGFNII